MIRKFHLPHRFPPEVIEEAQAIDSDIPADELRHRRDYRDLPIVTIDGETARDFDDAVHVRQLENGNYELQVHIADVAQYVTPNSPLDQEARLRGTSVYFPDRAVPMLPLELSTDICSLRPASRPPRALLHHGDRPPRRDRRLRNERRRDPLRRAHDLHRRERRARRRTRDPQTNMPRWSKISNACAIWQ